MCLLLFIVRQEFVELIDFFKESALCFTDFLYCFSLFNFTDFCPYLYNFLPFLRIDMDHFSSLLNLLQYCFWLGFFCMFWFSGHEACGILAPRPGIDPAPPALEGDVLSTGPLGKSLFLFWSLFCSFQDSGGKTYWSETFLLV